MKASCFQDILNCLSANFPKLKKHLRRFKNDVSGFVLIIDGKLVDNLNNLDKLILTGKTIEIIPIVMISGLITSSMILGSLITSLAVAKTIAFIANIIIISVISFGISFLVSKLLTPKDPKQVKTASFIFTSTENAAARNTPVPIAYGRLRVGSCLVSSIGINFDINSVTDTTGANSNSTSAFATSGGSSFAGGSVVRKLQN
jgi:predicted phage tail protein